MGDYGRYILINKKEWCNNCYRGKHGKCSGKRRVVGKLINCGCTECIKDGRLRISKR